ncbi:hypothetical protein J3459_004015 [Metarhizium acridum]|nr:hypothetical protein J3459_004015 [Metarhizium acridum]
MKKKNNKQNLKPTCLKFGSLWRLHQSHTIIVSQAAPVQARLGKPPSTLVHLRHIIVHNQYTNGKAGKRQLQIYTPHAQNNPQMPQVFFVAHGGVVQGVGFR